MIRKILSVFGLVRMSELKSATDRIELLKDYSNKLAAEAKRAGVNILMDYEASENADLESDVFLHGDLVCLVGARVSNGMVRVNPESRAYIQGVTIVPNNGSTSTKTFITSLDSRKAYYMASIVVPSAPDCATCNDEGAVGNILDTVPCPDCAAAPPAEHDEQAAFERAFVVQEGVFFSPERKEYRSMNGRTIEETDSIDLNLRLSGWMARAALAGFKPTVLSRCVLCDQLQADLTARDQQFDALRQGMKGDYDLDAWLAFVEEAPQLRLDAGRYRWLRSRDLEAISQGGVFAGLTPDNLVLNEETLDQAIDNAMAPDFVEASTHGRLNGAMP